MHRHSVTRGDGGWRMRVNLMAWRARSRNERTSAPEAAVVDTPVAAARARYVALTIAMTSAAIALAAAGQGITTRHLPHMIWPLGVLHRYLTAYGPQARTLSGSVILLVAGAVVFGLASLRSDAAASDEPMLDRTRPLPTSSAIDWIMLLGVAVGLTLWALFLLELYDGKYHHPLNIVLAIAVALVALPLVKRDFVDRRVGWSLSRALLLHAAFLAVVVGTFIAINMHDLGSWKYSAVGDEYNNFNYALAIARGGFFNPWTHRGVELLGADLGSATQALFMRLGNEDNFAWRFTAVVYTAAAFIPFYFLVRELFRARVAVLATCFVASSHYLFGYAHHGLYLDSLLSTSLGLWLLVIGLRRDSSVALFASGIALGFGFYMFESARAGVVIVSLFMLSFGIRAFRPAVFLPLAAGFILLALPLFATDGPIRVLHQMFRVSAIGYSSTITGDRWHRLAVNVQYSFVSFNYNTAGRHYVWGSFADPVTAALFVLGLGVVVFRIKRPAYRLLFIWWIVEVAFNGFSNPYPQPPISRMQAAVLPVGVCAALAVDAVARPLADRSLLRRWVSDRNWRVAGSAVAVAAVVPLVLYLNLYRFWYQLPRRFGTPTNETVVFRIYREPECDGRNVVVIAKDPLALLAKMMASYHVKPMPTFLYYPTAMALVSPNFPAGSASAAPNVGRPDCIIVQPSDVVGQTATVLNGIPRRFPGYVGQEFRDPSHERLSFLFAPAQAASGDAAPESARKSP